MFLEATTVISKKPDHRSSGTQKTKRLNHHCTHIIAGTIFTVTAMIQGYDSEKLRTDGGCMCSVHTGKCLSPW